MALPLLETKLFVPRQSTASVARPRLASLLERGVRGRLTLVSAPAGFGKSTLLGDWLAGGSEKEQSIAWVSLDQADSVPAAFWTYVAAALQRAGAAGGAARSLLEAPQPAIEAALATLLNDLAGAEAEVVLILDDYHQIEAPEIHGQLGFVLDHLPPRAHVVLATRSDPPLPLARLRAHRDLVEVRAADLRFTQAEAAAYLAAAGLDLDEREVEALEARTEGWIAALQLAVLSMAGREDVAGFIAGFAGDDRYVVDLLVEEALARQPAAVRRFLLATSILDHMSGSLCEAVTGQPAGQATLRSLEQANLFVVPLDDRRAWYRYHHLFAEMLRARLRDEEPDLVPGLHRRASDWFEQHGEADEAIRHALAGQDFERAALLIERAIPDLRRARRETTMRRWFEALPEELFAGRPVLSIGYVGALMANGEVQEVEIHLRDAERWLGPAALAGQAPAEMRPGMVVADEAELRRLPGAIAMYRAALAQLGGDVGGTLAHAHRALELSGDDDPLGRGGAAGFLALVHWGQGDLEAAHGYWAEAMASLQRAGHLVDAIGCARPLAEIRLAQGRLHDAHRAYEQGLQLASAQGPALLRGAADMHVGLAELRLEWNELDAAAEHLQLAARLGEQGGLAQNPYRWCVAMAQLREAEGATEAALDLLDEAERLYVSEYFPPVRPIGALRARLWGAHGRLREAMAWARARGLSVDDELSYLREFEHLTLARLLMVRARERGEESPLREAADLLKRLLAAAWAGGRERSAIEALVLLALAHHGLHDRPAALTHLAAALESAEEEGYVRTFLAEGQLMAALLSTAVRDGLAADRVRRLQGPAGPSRGQGAGPTAGRAPSGERLAEPLSERELEVLRLLGSELDGPAIARELVVALSTVRSHTKSIYAKLGVNGRRAAVRRGQELGLLPR